MNILRQTSTALALVLFSASAAVAASQSVDPKPFNTSDVPPHKSDTFVAESPDFDETRTYYQELFEARDWSEVKNFVYYPETGLMVFTATHPDGDVYDITVHPAVGEVTDIRKSKFKTYGGSES
jgi:hypothetical protein